jgi:pyruvate/2-oxoglutarate dehydrogenase complex dihydrolipoamide dehydrogenase (E3) component
MVCTVNPAAAREAEMDPAAAREAEMDPAPAPRRRRVLVAGGGPAGMEAARVAAARGHEVALWEREAALGGQLRLLARDPSQPLLARWLEWQERELERSEVALQLSTEVTREAVGRLGPEVVIVATGARPALPEIPGAGDPRVTTAEAVLAGSAQLGRRVVVLGGLEDHLRPLTISDLLAGRGHSVRLVTELLNAGRGVEGRTLHQLLKRVLEHEVAITTMTAVTAIDESCLRTRSVITGRPSQPIEDFDSVVVAVGGVAIDELSRSLKGLVGEIHTIGDSLAPRRLIHAVLDGARTGHLV